MNSSRLAPQRTRTFAAPVRAAGLRSRTSSWGLPLALLLLSSPAFAAFPNQYSYCKIITTQHTMVSGPSDLANYPLTVSLTDPALKTTSNGGLVNNSNGYDVGFGPDCSGAGALLKWEMEFYDPATGAILAHVLRPTLSHTVDDTIGIYYGAAFSTFQSTPSAVWVNYAAVWHLNEATNTQALDSTTAAKNSTTNVSTRVAGKLGFAQSFSKAAGNALVFPRVFTTQSDYTISGWINVSTAEYGIVLDHRAGGSLGPLVYTLMTSGKASSFFNPPSDEVDSTATAADNAWHYIVGTRSGNTMSIYVDGNAAVTKTISANSTWGSDARIAQDMGDGFHSQISDETRVSTIARSADWILTEYRNQNTPGAYLSLGPQIPSSAPTPVRHRASGGD